MAKPQVLLQEHLKALRLPTFLREYSKLARQCASEGVDYPRYLLRLSELELLDRVQSGEVRSRRADSFEALPCLNKNELARCEYNRQDNSGTGKTHVALALGLAACQRGYRVRFTALVNELLEARDEKRSCGSRSCEARLSMSWACRCLSRSGAAIRSVNATSVELLTSNLPFNEWTEILGLTGALLDRLKISEMNGELSPQSKRARA